MAKRYRSHKEAWRTRVEACNLAAAMMSADDWDGQASKDRLWSLCVFFETYIASGSKVTRRYMDILPEESATVVQLVPKG